VYTILTLGIWYLIENQFLALRLWDCQYSGKTPTNQSYVYEEIKNRLDSGNAYCQSVPNLLSSNLLYKNMKIKTSRNMILSVVLMGVKLKSLTLQEEQRLRAV
jgi:hypothetical protein